MVEKFNFYFGINLDNAYQYEHFRFSMKLVSNMTSCFLQYNTALENYVIETQESSFFDRSFSYPTNLIPFQHICGTYFLDNWKWYITLFKLSLLIL